MKVTGRIVSVFLSISLLISAIPAGAVTFQQVSSEGGTAISTQPAVTGQGGGTVVSGGASQSKEIARDNSPALSRSASNEIGKAYREMALVAVEAHVDLSNFIYADPDKTPEEEMEVRYERCMRSLDDLDKKARRVDQAITMARIAAAPLPRGGMQALLEVFFPASPAYAAYAPQGLSYGVNQTGILNPLKQISVKVSQRVKQIQKSLPSPKVDTEALREQVGRWLSAVKAGAGVVAGAATFTAGATLVVTATPLGIAVGIPLAIGGVMGGADAIITGTEDMQSVSTDDLGYEITPSDSTERDVIAKGAKIGNYISIVTSTKSAGEFITSVLQAPNEAVEAAEIVGTPIGNAIEDMISESGGSGVSNGTAILAGPEPPLCPGTYIGTPGMKPGKIDKVTKSYEDIKKVISTRKPGYGLGPGGKNWWEAIWEATGANVGGGEGGGNSGGCSGGF